MDQPLPFQHLTTTTKDVNLTDIAPWSTSGARTLITKSMTTLGSTLTDPILQELPDNSEYRYRVLDGARRLDYCLDHGIPTITAKIVPHGISDSTAAAVTVVTNLARTTNAVQEALAFKAMLDDGMTETTIAKTLGINANVVRKRLKLLAVPPQLLAGVKTGKIAPGVAQRIANLRSDQQQALVQQYELEGAIIGADVADVQRASRAALADKLAQQGIFPHQPADTLTPRPAEVLTQHIRIAKDNGLTREDALALVKNEYEANR